MEYNDNEVLKKEVLKATSLMESEVLEAYKIGYSQGYDDGKEESKKQSYKNITSSKEDRIKGRAEGRLEAWECAKKIIHTDRKILSNMFGNKSITDIFERAPSAIIEQLNEWEKSQKMLNEIKVGDEVCRKDNKHCKLVALSFRQFSDIAMIDCVNQYGETYIINIENVERTGKHFDGVVELFNHMREADNNDTEKN